MNKKMICCIAPIIAGCLLVTSGMAVMAWDSEIDNDSAPSSEQIQDLYERLQEKPKKPVVFSLTSELNVYVDGQISVALSDEYSIGKKVTLHAPDVEGKNFVCWEVATPNSERTVSSTKPDFTMVLNSNTDVYAVYETSSAAPAMGSVVSFTTVKPINYAGNNVISLTATRSIAEGDTVSAAGFVYSSNELLAKSADVNVLESTEKDDLIASLKEEINDEENEGTKVKVYEVDVIGNTDGDWTLNLVPSDKNMRYYMMSYVVVNGEKIYSEPISLKYSEMVSASSDMLDVTAVQNNGN